MSRSPPLWSLHCRGVRDGLWRRPLCQKFPCCLKDVLHPSSRGSGGTSSERPSLAPPFNIAALSCCPTPICCPPLFPSVLLTIMYVISCVLLDAFCLSSCPPLLWSVLRTRVGVPALFVAFSPTVYVEQCQVYWIHSTCLLLLIIIHN